MFKENIEQLKASVKKQQDQILGGESVGNNNGLLADHIRKTEKNFRDVASQSQSMADKCIGQYDAAVKAANQQLAQQQKDYAKQQSELGQKQQEFCQRFNQALGGHPGPACDGNIGDLVRSVGNQGNEFAAYCDEAQNTSSAKDRATIICQNKGVNKVTQVVSDSDVKKDQEYRKKEDAIYAKKQEIERLNAATPKSLPDVQKAESDLRTLERELGDLLETVRARLLAAKEDNNKSNTSNSTSQSDLDNACTKFNECK
jgi:hypothetical protein